MNKRFEYTPYAHEGMVASHYLTLTEKWGALTRKEATLWSLRKWEAIAEFYDGDMGTTINDTGGVTCALCNLYSTCGNCPIKQATGGHCGDPRVPWGRYCNAAALGLRDEAREAAVAMVELLSSIYKEMS